MIKACRLALAVAVLGALGCSSEPEKPAGLVLVQSAPKLLSLGAEFLAPGSEFPEVGACAKTHVDLVHLPQSLSAGIITAAVRHTAVAIAPMEADPVGFEYESGAAESSLEAGDEVVVTATGDEVPRFTLSATVPEPIVIDAPAKSQVVEKYSVLIPARGGYALSWPPTSEEVMMVFSGDGDPEFRHVDKLICLFDGKPGKAVVSESDLAGVRTQGGGILLGSSARVVRTTVGEWPVALAVVVEAHEPDGQLSDHSF